MLRKKIKKTNKFSNSRFYFLDSKFCSRGGQLLIEMLVALGILTIGFLGVMSLLSRAIGLNRVVSDNYTATYLAEEGIELTKNILDSAVISGAGWAGIGGPGGASFSSGDFEAQFDSRWLIGRNGSEETLTFDPNSRQYGYGFSQPTPFKRNIHITLKTNEVVVNSKVEWISRGGGSFNVDLEDHFFNWR